jgi:hypothetical protein
VPFFQRVLRGDEIVWASLESFQSVPPIWNWRRARPPAKDKSMSDFGVIKDGFDGYPSSGGRCVFGNFFSGVANDDVFHDGRSQVFCDESISDGSGSIMIAMD